MLNINRNGVLKIKNMGDNKMKIVISELAYKQMSYIIKNSNQEVGWIVTVDKDEITNTFRINECIILDQEVNGVTCELSPNALNELALSLISSGNIETYESIGGWCHSHVNMTVLPSSQDNEQMKYFKEGNDWFLRGIGNKSGEMKFDLFDYKNGLVYEDLSWSVERPVEVLNKIKLLKEQLAKLTSIEDKSVEDAIISELLTKVKQKKYEKSKWTNTYYSPYKSSYSVFDDFVYDELIDLHKDGEEVFKEVLRNTNPNLTDYQINMAWLEVDEEVNIMKMYEGYEYDGVLGDCLDEDWYLPAK